MNKYLFLFCCLALTSFPLSAQDFDCGFDPWLEIISESPGIQADLNTMDQVLAQSNSTHKDADTALYSLPIVFHILHQNGPENISDSLVKAGLDLLNQSFANQGWYDQGSGSNTYLQFCLTQRGKYNEPSTGIEHVESPYTLLTNPEDDSNLKLPFSWDTAEMLNVYVVKEISFASGYSSFPNITSDPLDGIVIESRFFTNGPEGITVLSHEIGHYLGLYHTFQAGCRNFDCLLEGDRVCDTPPDLGKFEGCQSSNTCNTDTDDPSPNNPFTQDEPDPNNNYMDYNDEACYHAFTDGQTARMREMLRRFRPLWWRSQRCTPQQARDLSIYETKNLEVIECRDSISPEIRVINHGHSRVSGLEITLELDGTELTSVYSPATFNPDGSVRWIDLPSFSNPGPGHHQLKIWTSSPSGIPDDYPANDTFYHPFVVPFESRIPEQEDFNNGLPSTWIEYQPFGDNWKSIEVGGCDNASPNRAIYLENKLFVSPMDNFYFSPAFDLSGQESVRIRFETSLAKQEEYDFLQSAEFGIYQMCDPDKGFILLDRTQISLAEKSILDLSFIWKPESCEDWGRVELNLDDYEAEKVVFFIVNRIGINDYHRLYIDNWEISSNTAVVKAQAGLQPTDVKLWPVPSSAQMQVEIDAYSEEDLFVRVFDPLGRLLFSQQLASTQSRQVLSLPVEQWETSRYFLDIRQGENRVVKQFLKAD